MTTETINATKSKLYRRLGSLPGCIALGCPDIGEAILPDGRRVVTTWGRNLDRESAEWFTSEAMFELIQHTAADHYEIILPPCMSEPLESILRDTATVNERPWLKNFTL